MSKQDRQGVRTASDLERKYNLGAFASQGDAIDEQSIKVSQLNQALSQHIASTNAVFKSMQEQIEELENASRTVYAEISEKDGVYSLLEDVTYQTLSNMRKSNVHIILYRNIDEGSVRYYHCMGMKNNELVFQFGFDGEFECLSVGEGDVINATSYTV